MPSVTRLLDSNPIADCNSQPLLPLSDKDIKSISGNSNCVYITTGDEKILCNKDGYCNEAWQNCPELESKGISYIDSGSTFHVGLTHFGKIFSWVDKEDGQHEQNDELIDMSLPRLVTSLNGSYVFGFSNKVLQISCGVGHTVFLTTEGRIGVWGVNSNGQLGLGSKAAEHYNEPQMIDCLAGIPFIQVTAGGYHTCALTVSGAVFGWGKNSSGQLGFKKSEKQRFPAPCRELRTEMITHISCGENHSAMLSRDGRVFSYGLDIDNHSDVTFQKVVDGEIHALKEMKVSAVACGSQNIIAYASANGKIFVYGLGQTEIQLDNIEDGVALFTANGLTFVHSSHLQNNQTESRLIDRMPYFHQTSKIPEPYLKQNLEPLFSSASIWNGSFLLCRHQEVHRANHGVDMEMVKNFFDFLKKESINSNCVKETLTEALKDLIKELPRQPSHVEALRLYLMFPTCHLMEDTSMHDTIIGPFADSFKRLDKISKKIIDAWLKAIPIEHFRRYLKIFKDCVCQLISSLRNNECETMTRSLHSCIWLMDKLYTINERRDTASKVSYEEFYVPELSTVNKYNDYIDFLRDEEKGRNDVFYFCKYPFLYKPEYKALLLKYQNRMAMIDADASYQSQESIELCKLFNVSPPATTKMNVDQKIYIAGSNNPVFVVLDIERDTIVKDTKQLIKKLKQSNRHKGELVVRFKNEDAVGQGVYQEYFTLLFIELLKPDVGIFCKEEESNLLWFKPLSESDPDLYHLTGYMLGLAVYNSKLLDVPFPLALFKKLMDVPISFEDYIQFKPLVAKNLKGLESLNAEEIQSLDLDFGNLCEGGNDRQVTKDNLHEFIKFRADSQFNTERKEEFDLFYQGFHEAVDIEILNKLKIQPSELQFIIVGEERELDVTAMQKTVTYVNPTDREHPYDREHPTINYFWQILNGFSPKDKKLLTRFITGTERMPHGGLDLKIYPFEISGEETRNIMPVIATCSNTLFLPDIQDRDRLENRLLAAMRCRDRFTSLNDALGRG